VFLISQVLLAMALLLMLHAEKEAHAAWLASWHVPGPGVWELSSEWDYTPRAAVWLILADLPAMLVVAPFGALGVSGITGQALVVVFAGLFWYWVGRGLERRLKQAGLPQERPRAFATSLNGLGLVGSTGILVSIVWSLYSGTAVGLLLVGAIMAWCLSFMAYFGVRFARRWWPKLVAPSSPLGKDS
jgi:hypothetical protein